MTHFIPEVQHEGDYDKFTVTDIPDTRPDTPIDLLRRRYYETIDLPRCLCGSAAQPRRVVGKVGKAVMSVQVCGVCGGRV